MSYGYSRNMAVQIAENVQRNKLPYADAIKCIRLRFKISCCFKDLREHLIEVMKNIANVWKGILKGM